MRNDLHYTTYEWFLVAGNNENVNKIDYYNNMVSFWKYQKPSNLLELVCLGILIRSNWIFLTTNCADELKPYDDIVIQYGGYAIHNTFPTNIKIVGKELIESRSKYSILYVSNSIFH